mmetsp:Transcript_11881/g.29269  ORF Transcript_11881/g.29269 Transcript_11881/m.29269 type:complete len:303 (-) Transcript_11881:1532-2440(-)
MLHRLVLAESREVEVVAVWPDQHFGLRRAVEHVLVAPGRQVLGLDPGEILDVLDVVQVVRGDDRPVRVQQPQVLDPFEPPRVAPVVQIGLPPVDDVVVPSELEPGARVDDQELARRPRHVQLAVCGGVRADDDVHAVHLGVVLVGLVEPLPVELRARLEAEAAPGVDVQHLQVFLPDPIVEDGVEVDLRVDDPADLLEEVDGAGDRAGVHVGGPNKGLPGELVLPVRVRVQLPALFWEWHGLGPVDVVANVRFRVLAHGVVAQAGAAVWDHPLALRRDGPVREMEVRVRLLLEGPGAFRRTV